MNNDYNSNNFNSSNGYSNSTTGYDQPFQTQNNDFYAKEEKPNFGSNFCNNCGNKIQPNEKFCTKCGADLNQAESSNCEQCGAPIVKGTNFCNSCGAPVSKTQKMFCQFCGEKYEAGETFCKKCGNKINKAESFFGNNTNVRSNNTSIHSSSMPIYNLSNPITKLHLVLVGIVLLMFIFSFIPAFSFDVDMGGYSSSAVNKTVDDILEINIMNPFSSFDKFKELDDDVEFVANLGVLIAIVQSAAFIGTFAVVLLPLLKPTKSKLSNFIPIIFSICALIYTFLLILLFGAILEESSDGMTTAEPTFAAWAYIILAIALIVTTIITNKKKKELAE